MLNIRRPYKINFIQKASPTQSDAFDFSYIYKFYSDKTPRCQRLKYIIRAEAHEDVFAIKFYAARDRKLDTKYNRILKIHNYSSTLRILITCAYLIPILLKEFPEYSFIINGARSIDFKSGKMEKENSTQRFRIYRVIADTVFGSVHFQHFSFDEISSYLIVNRKNCDDIEAKKERIKKMFIERYRINI